jgi:hypothetical protein
MTDMSQTVDDIVRRSKKTFANIEVDRPLATRTKELFENAKVPLDPRIYKGEARAYVSKGQIYESPVKMQERMSRNSQSVKDWFGGERYDIERKLPPSQRGYNFRRDTAGNAAYSQSFEDIAKQYLMGEGKELYAHLRGQGRDFYDITKIGTADLEGAVAALATNGVEAALLGSKDFEQKVSQLAANYGVSVDRAISYVLAHEFVHASQKGKYFDDPVLAELDVEHTLNEYFNARGDKDLAVIASDRADNVTRNYGGIGAYGVPKGISERGSIESYLGPGKGYSGKGDGKGYAGSVAAGADSGTASGAGSGSYASASAASSN